MAEPDDMMMEDLLDEESTDGNEDDSAFDDALDTASEIYYRRVEGASDEGEPPPEEARPVKLKPGGPRPKISLKTLGKAGE